MLKFIIPDEEEFNKLTPELQGLYTEDGSGRYTLQVDGAVPKKQLDEFRKTNIELRKTVDSYKIGDELVSPEVVKELIGKKAEFEAGTDPKKIEGLVEAKVGDLRKLHAEELKKLSDENAGLKSKNARTIIEKALRDAGAKAGLRASAEEDLIARGLSVFTLGEGDVLEAMDNGEQRYARNGDRLNPENWVGELVKSAPHLFEPSSGGGGQNQNRPSGGKSQKNPWAPGTDYNLTEQGRILKEDRPLAKQLAAAHGITIN